MNKLICSFCNHDLADVCIITPKFNDPQINPKLTRELNGSVYSCRYKDDVIWACGCVFHNIAHKNKEENLS